MRRIDEDHIEVTRVDDIFNKDAVTGNPVLVKKNVISKLVINPSAIKITEQFINIKGKVLKGRCIITYDGGKELLLKENYRDIVSLQKRMVITGFKYKGKV